MKDPQRWSESSSAPKGFEDLLAGVDEPRELSSGVRKHVRAQLTHATVLPVSPRLTWRAPVLGAVAVALGGVLLWAFLPGKQEPAPALRADVADLVDRAAEPEVGSPVPVQPTQIRVESDPPGAIIFMDEVERGQAPLMIPTEPGEHLLRAQLADYEPQQVSVRAERGERLVVALALRRAAATPEPVARTTMRGRGDLVDPFARSGRHQAPMQGGEGVLMVNSVPWTRVYIDGRRSGNTPLRAQLPAGRHRVRLVTDDGQAVTLTVTIRAGQTHRIIRNMREASTNLVDPFADR